MATRAPMAAGEWYHCYSRGVDKRTVFETSADYERFLLYLFVSNGTKNLRISDFKDTRLTAVLGDVHLDQADPLVEIGAYSLMPNHVHIMIRAIQEHGIATFMQKIFTGYTMYFNNGRQRTGSLFSGTYKAKHITDDRYLKQAFPYVLLNPIELFEPRWKEGAGNLTQIEQELFKYPYSSLMDFYGVDRPENKIVSNVLETYYDTRPTLPEMLSLAQEYYQEHFPQV